MSNPNVTIDNAEVVIISIKVFCYPKKKNDCF